MRKVFLPLIRYLLSRHSLFLYHALRSFKSLLDYYYIENVYSYKSVRNCTQDTSNFISQNNDINIAGNHNII